MTRTDLSTFIAEDVGAGDITTLALVDASTVARGRVIARERCVLAGAREAHQILTDAGASVKLHADDGATLDAGAVVLEVEGNARAILTAERLALNFLMRMSGIATVTRDVQGRVARANPACKVAATRKTTPGFRAFEKRAVTIGGGDPHRFGLFDAFLVKDNHLASGVSVADAVARCRAFDAAKLVEVEADTEAQALAAARAGADYVLLDNFTPQAALATAAKVRAVDASVRIECSGGIRFEDAHLWAPAADRVSLGRLTMDARVIDFGLDF